MRSKSSPDVLETPSFIEAARKAQIIECAIATVAELGYGRASLAEIAKRAGISKSVISYYFASKDDLIRQVVDAVYVAGGAFMTGQVESQKNATDALRVYIELNIAFMRAERQRVQALVEIVRGFRDELGVQQFDPGDLEPVAEDLAALLRWGQQSGEFREFSPIVMSHAIRAAIDALPPHLARHSDAELDATAAELVTMFHLATTKRSGLPKPRGKRL